MIIDVCVTPPHREVLKGFLDPPPHLAGYYDVYTMGPEMEEYIANFEPEHFIAMMDAAGIDIAVLQGEDQETTFNKRISTEIVAVVVHA